MVTSVNMLDRILEKNIQNGRQKSFFLNKASEMFISTKIDLLITNLIIFSQLNVSFPVKVEKHVKILKKSND